MGNMKWEKIKKSVAGYVYDQIVQGRDWVTMTAILLDATMGPRPGEALVSSLRRVYAEKAIEIIDGWDIRQVGRLRELFPDGFPSSLRRGTLVADHDARGDWQVCAV